MWKLITLAQIVIPVPPGELIDKITILEIKAQRLDHAEKLKNVQRELSLLRAEQDKHISMDAELSRLQQQLRAVNEKIWDLENDIRDCEAREDFGEKFIGVARQIYATNDHRARLKREINTYLGSELLEEKSYRE